MYYGKMPWIKWFSGEYDEHNQAKLKQDTPEDIKKEYEQIFQTAAALGLTTA